MKKLKFVLCWHMHQPYYREGLDGDYRLPWVYLHAIKDYDDMAAHLEKHPGMRAVVNFAPVLLEQLEDYAAQIKRFLDQGEKMSDPMLNLLAGVSPIPENPSQRLALIQSCRRAHAQHMIEPYPHFHAMLEPFQNAELSSSGKLMLQYLDTQYFTDLLTWYHLAWCSHNLKQTPLVQTLIKKNCGFDTADAHQLMQLIQRTITSIIPRYRKLAERGQIELSMTPWGHPIVPLLNDFSNMKEAQPEAPMPEHSHYPHGSERSRWHLSYGLERFEHHFGCKPVGVWLSEGAVSDDALSLLDEMNIQWTASGEAVWHHSCLTSACDPAEMACRKALFTPYRLNQQRTRIYFRDDGLSDLIGFEYSKWHADDAVADFTGHLTRIADTLGDAVDEHVVSVILDGENAWEYYPDNGYYFLNRLYQTLAEHPHIEPTTFSSCHDAIAPRQLNHLVAGSWVYGSFSTWIGSPEKNRAWDLLVEAKKAYDEHCAALPAAQQQKVTRLLGICEGSDWFWWFGDYNPADSVNDFDRLYRKQIRLLYIELGLTPPAALDTPLSNGGGSAENAGTMRRN